MTTKKRKKRKFKLFRFIGFLLALLLIIGGITAFVLFLGIVKDLPDWKPEDLAAASTSFIYDINGNEVVKLHVNENRTPVELSEIPDHLIDAFIATEDVRFRKHHGVDLKRVFGALIADIRHRSFSEGASTLTMQLVRNAILGDQEKKIERKIKEAVLAIQVERHYTKDEILALYLNEIYFGHGTHGVQAAAQYYFGKDVGELTLGESAMLTGLVRNPRIYSPFLNPENALNIRDVVLNNMVRHNKVGESVAKEAKKEELQLTNFQKTNVYVYPWFSDYIIDQAEELLKTANLDPNLIYTGGLRIHSTLDPIVQKAAEEAYNSEDNFPKSNTADPIQSALAVMDPKTGQVKALIGGREHLTKRGLNRATDIKRQPGSAIKPISVYGPALEEGYSPSSVVDDIPTSFGSSSKPYKPVNYDGKYRGLITMREAVQYSVNIPAVKFLSMIGISVGFDFAKSLGLPLDDTNDQNLSLALGGLTRGVSPLQLAAAYAAFDNQGVYIEPHVITRIEDIYGKVIIEVNPKKTVAMTEQTAYLMTDMLKTVVDYGTGTRAKMNRPVAGKTGTTQLPDKAIFNNVRGSSNKDAWFAAYTPELVGVVWMGYDEDMDANGKPNYLKQVYGGQYPARIWKFVMERSLKDMPVNSFTKPSGIVSQSVDIKSGKLPSELTPSNFIRNEIFAKGHVPNERSDIWVSAEICATSKMVANTFCPAKQTSVYINKSPSYSKAMDVGLYLPKVTCDIHGGLPSNTETEETVLIGICLDPRHGGKAVLAKSPRQGETGGCPQESVEYRTFEPGTIPTEYCNLPEHKVIKSVTTPEEGKNDEGDSE